ncbi:hypothetical protein JD844_019611 [Phrynosoma platyrhinos]|uniref:ODAD1 central coiled coil region domain-containing protein n=1 Tax=Phrynosoma platyrhinos TaxID=52577 RepID=A0ABQ7TQT2_PHRPL|nr:hypothetical protein JD844_019611 [Phrynosoma platyrhinos]
MKSAAKVMTAHSLRQRGSHNRSETSEYTEKEREIMADIELRKLQQQFRIMMESRKSFGFKTEQILYQQEKQIHVLKQENEEISLIQSLIQSPQNLLMDEQNCLALKFLLQTKDKCLACIRATKALLADLDDKILQLEGKIKKQKILVIRMRQEYEGKRLQKRIHLLDNRLNQLTVRFDTLLTINARLREEIENLQIQKTVFDSIYWRLYRQLDQQRKTIDFSIERTEALARISAMKERRAKDLTSFNIEFRDLERVYNHETKLRAFMFMKLKTTEDANWAEFKLKESRKILDQLKSSVGLLFRELDCDATKIKEHLGESGDITDQNLLDYLTSMLWGCWLGMLGVKKSNNLLLIESFLHYKDVEGELDSVPMLNPFLGGSAALKKVEPIKIAPPSLSVDPFADTTEPSVEAPLDYKSLRALVLENQEKIKSRGDSAERGVCSTPSDFTGAVVMVASSIPQEDLVLVVWDEGSGSGAGNECWDASVLTSTPFLPLIPITAPLAQEKAEEEKDLVCLSSSSWPDIP